MANNLAIEAVPGDAQLEKLAERAKMIQDALTEPPTTVVVEFSGSPKSGKSTNIDIIHHFFKRSGFKVWAPSEGASKRTPYTLRRDLVAFNAWSLNYAISELLLSYHNVDKPNLVILDRGPFDSLAWMGVLKDGGDLDGPGYEVIKAFALHPKWAKLIDRVYLFTCSPEKSLSRETSTKLTVKPGIAMNPEMLRSLLSQYAQLEQELDDYPVYAVHTDSEYGPKASSFAITTDILDCFSKKMGVG